MRLMSFADSIVLISEENDMHVRVMLTVRIAKPQNFISSSLDFCFKSGTAASGQQVT